jgi:glucarate dehydratase
VRVPEGPGLGIELDPEEMRRWSGHFAEHGPLSYFQDPRNPGRYNRLPLH